MFGRLLILSILVLPGHLKTLLSYSSAEAGVNLFTTLTDFVNAILRGEVLDFAVSTFFGATLCALTKKDGGIRPIAVGNTLRKLAAKVGARPLSHSLGSELSWFSWVILRRVVVKLPHTLQDAT